MQLQIILLSLNIKLEGLTLVDKRSKYGGNNDWEYR